MYLVWYVCMSILDTNDIGRHAYVAVNSMVPRYVQVSLEERPIGRQKTRRPDGSG